MNEAENAIGNYLQTVQSLLGNSAASRRPKTVEEWLIGCPFARFWKLGGAAAAPLPRKQCFKNAFVLASSNPGGLAYVEGLALTSGIPLHHAWCVDPDGNVIEPTWPDLGQAYFGVALDIDAMRAHVLAKGTYGFIEGFREADMITHAAPETYAAPRWATPDNPFMPTPAPVQNKPALASRSSEGSGNSRTK